MRTHPSAFSGSVRRKLTCLRICHYFAPAPSSSALYGPEPFSSSYHNALGHMAPVSSRFQYRAELPIRMIMPVASWLSTNYTSRPLDTSANCLSSTTGQQLRPFMASWCNPHGRVSFPGLSTVIGGCFLPMWSVEQFPTKIAHPDGFTFECVIGTERSRTQRQRELILRWDRYYFLFSVRSSCR